MPVKSESVDDGWLESVGFEHHRALHQWSFRISRLVRLLYWPVHKAGDWLIECGEECREIRPGLTRGDVRLLCSLLGKPLEETNARDADCAAEAANEIALEAGGA
jgi:hypothetical protein